MMPGSSDPPEVRPSSDNHLAEVTSVKDVGRTGRIKVRLLSYDGVETQDGLIEARLCAPFAGDKRGAFFVPDVGDEVLVTFVNGDPRQAVVLGGLWNGKSRPEQRLGGDGARVDRWIITGKKGTRIAIVEEGGGAFIRLSTTDASGNDLAFCDINRDGGGRIELSAGGTTLVLDGQGVRIETAGDFQVTSSTGSMTCATLDVSSGQATFSGQVMANTVQTPSVVGACYTPGCGNVW